MIQLPLTGIPVAVRIGDTVMRNGECIGSIIKIYSQEGEKYLVDVFKSSTKYHKNIYLSPENWTGGILGTGIILEK